MNNAYQSIQLQLENARSLVAMKMEQIGLGIYTDIIVRISEDLKKAEKNDPDLSNLLLLAKYELVDQIRKNPQYLYFIEALGELIQDQAMSLGPIQIVQSSALISSKSPPIRSIRPAPHRKGIHKHSSFQISKESSSKTNGSRPPDVRQRAPISSARPKNHMPLRQHSATPASTPTVKTPDQRFNALSATRLGLSQEHFSKMASTRVCLLAANRIRVAGMDEVKRELRRVIEYPIKIPKIFRHNVWPTTGLLLYGPAGTGKTLIASSVATQAGYNFFNVAISDIVSKWKGEAVLCVRALYTIARACAPSVVFIDEIDALVCNDSRTTDETSVQIRTELQTQLDGFQHKISDSVEESLSFNPRSLVITIGATNFPWKLDGPILRRFTNRIYIGLPDEATVKELLTMCVDFNRQDSSVTIDWLISRLAGFSSAEISAIASRAQLLSYEEAFSELASTTDLAENNQTIILKSILTTQQHWNLVISDTKRVISPNDVKRYEDWQTE
ncbi:P60 katanin [Giardia lamblia P15]|uniref:p60 katanin n=1 Tax=Giardia intestinalis (strain P15) TaxID=658858 RepID=E1EYJ7_GIAIA|nr:P60 katanin [Giardia lamblia P15]